MISPHYLLVRLASSIAVLFMALTATFFLIQLAPGGLSILMDPNLAPEDRAQIAANLGLDQPPHVQYARWLTTLAKGDLGDSLTYGRPVLDMIVERLPATILLASISLALTLLIGIPLGIYSALRQHSIADQILSFGSFIGLATPNFWLGILLIILFSVRLGWLPASGMQGTGDEPVLWDRLRHLIMPAVVLSTSTLAQIMRYTRSSWINVIHQDFVRVARAKGLAELTIQMHHVSKNALIPIITIFGLFLPRLVGGSAIVETLFGWPGLGRLAVDAASRRDTPLVLGATIVVALMVIASNLVIDLLYPLLDPRIRQS